ncbi:hypothetical protein N8Z24_00705 [bacterium]|nr:hypothetical protein [bacterium]
MEKELKECSICGEILPFSAFHKNRRAKSGRFAHCIECNRKKYDRTEQTKFFFDEEKRLLECSVCRKIQSFDKYNKNHLAKFGINPACKACRRKRRGSKKRLSSIDPENRKKECSICRKIKDFSEYTLNSSAKYGVHSCCIACLAEKRQSKEYKKYMSEYIKNKTKKDINFRLMSRLRSRITKVLRGEIKPASVSKELGCSIEELKSHLESRFYMCSSTGEKMTWDNYGYRSWHIDHIIPLSSFDLTDKEQFKKAVHYSNLQPLWAEDNYSKGSKIDYPTKSK